MSDTPMSIVAVTDQLRALGVRPGGVLLVHSAFSKVRPIEGGPLGLIAALRRAVGESTGEGGGTLVMPSMSDDDEHPFDRAATPCLGMGIVAETFWRQPGVLRSDSPHAFAAVGAHAAAITTDHPPQIPHGPDSPVGRVADLDGQVLLLGVGHDGNTTVHLGEWLGGVRYRIPKTLVVRQDGRPVTIAYDEIDHCCQNFDRVDGWLEARGLQRRGPVGHGQARLMRARDVVEVVTAQLRADETAFLHPPGVDEECDAARASIPAGPRAS